MSTLTTRATASRVAAAAAAASLGLTLTGCGEDDEPTTQTTVTAAPSSPSASPSANSDDTAQTALLAAGRLVLGKVPNTTLTSIETDAGGWEVQVVDASGVETQADTDAQGSSITSGPLKQDDDAEDRAEHLARVKAAKLDFAAAVAAVGKTSQGQITELNLDSDRGKTVWEADVQVAGQPKVEVRIDAGTGQVVGKTQAQSGDDDFDDTDDD